MKEELPLTTKFLWCGAQAMNPPQAKNCTFGSPSVQSDKLCQTFTPLDRLILPGEKRNLSIEWRYRQVL